MRLPRVSPAAYVIDRKIYVTGGSRTENIENWGEVCDPKTNTWEPILLTSLDLTVQNVLKNGLKPYWTTEACLVIDKVPFLIIVSDGKLYWRETKESCAWWWVVYGLGEQSSNQFRAVANSGGEGRVIVWWKSVTKVVEVASETEEGETKIWCAEISFERRGLRELQGFVEWSKEVFSVDGCDFTYDFILKSVLVTY